ncbi:MAG: hypothetical protein FMNOHCHN_03584 [Ignavibacteriaceae bacterium]|jgi:hypothetical protein|nr:hypothetical protein [Ignavibacteriaceae bacterium]
MQEIKAVHRVHRKPDGNPVRREFTLRTWQLLPTKTINGVTYPKMGYELESSVQNSFVPQESVKPFKAQESVKPLDDMNIKELKEFIKDKELDVKANQPKDDILADLKNLGYE